MTSSFSSNTSHDESILLQASRNIWRLQADESLVPPFAPSEEAIEWIYDIPIRIIIQTLLLTILTKFRGCSTRVYKEKLMFVTGCKASRNK